MSGIRCRLMAAAIIPGLLWCTSQPGEAPPGGATAKTAVFACPAGKSIRATFHLPADEAVELVLSDGRRLTLAHAPSASGARYADPADRLVFWSKGNTAFLEEDGRVTYRDCRTGR